MIMMPIIIKCALAEYSSSSFINLQNLEKKEENIELFCILLVQHVMGFSIPSRSTVSFSSIMSHWRFQLNLTVFQSILASPGVPQAHTFCLECKFSVPWKLSSPFLCFFSFSTLIKFLWNLLDKHQSSKRGGFLQSYDRCTQAKTKSKVQQRTPRVPCLAKVKRHLQLSAWLGDSV